MTVTLPQRIKMRQLREEKRWSLGMIARHMGVKKSTVHHHVADIPEPEEGWIDPRRRSRYDIDEILRDFVRGASRDDLLAEHGLSRDYLNQLIHDELPARINGYLRELEQEIRDAIADGDTPVNIAAWSGQSVKAVREYFDKGRVSIMLSPRLKKETQGRRRYALMPYMRQIVRSYNEGLSLEQVARKIRAFYGQPATPSAVRNVLLRAGVKLRPSGGSRPGRKPTRLAA